MKKKSNKMFRHSNRFVNRTGLLIRQLLFSMLLLFAANSFAQESKTVKGVVTDPNSEPIIGATVIVKGTTIGTVTDANGEFSINIPASENNTLVISFLGMLTDEIDVSSKSNVTVEMKTDITVLEDVVVVGYGTQKKESIVGAITQTKGETLEKIASKMKGNAKDIII